MRTFNDLNDIDKGAYIVMQEIIKYKNNTQEQDQGYGSEYLGYIAGLDQCLEICEECLDYATLGEITGKP